MRRYIGWQKKKREKMISIIVPVRDEPELGKFLLKLFNIMHPRMGDYEVIIAMGDREKEFPDILNLPNQCVIKTYGDSLERSILSGFSHAKGGKLAVCDADGYHPIEQLPQMFKLLDKYEMVVGSRYISGGQANHGVFRDIISWCFVQWAHLFGSVLTDPMTGFFAVRKDVIDKVKYKPFTWKTCLEIEMKAHPNVIEIPMIAGRREVGVSKSSIKVGLKLMWDILTSGGE